MLSHFSLVSLDEFKALGTRVALYTTVAYLTIRAVGFITDRTSRWVGLSDDTNQ